MLGPPIEMASRALLDRCAAKLAPDVMVRNLELLPLDGDSCNLGAVPEGLPLFHGAQFTASDGAVKAAFRLHKDCLECTCVLPGSWHWTRCESAIV